jgi:hypothetical protein
MSYMIRTIMPRDRITVEKWLSGKDGVELFDWSLLPPIGQIIPDCAAGWIYRTDSPVAIIDPLVRNPEITKELADSCLDSIVSALIKIARNQHPTGQLPRIRVLVAHARQPAVIARAERFGFTRGRDDYAPLRLEL